MGLDLVPHPLLWSGSQNLSSTYYEACSRVGGGLLPIVVGTLRLVAGRLMHPWKSLGVHLGSAYHGRVRHSSSMVLPYYIISPLQLYLSCGATLAVSMAPGRLVASLVAEPGCTSYKAYTCSRTKGGVDSLFPGLVGPY
jgi:hypothetical protein